MEDHDELKPEGSKQEGESEQILLTFLRQTREGKFAKVDEYSLKLLRASERTESDYGEEQYLYSMR